MGIKASRVAPAPASPLYPAVGAPCDLPPAATAFPQPSVRAQGVPSRLQASLWCCEGGHACPTVVLLTPRLAPTCPAPAPQAPSEADLQLEAQRAAALAGEAFRMASQAQNLLDTVARTTSRSQPSSPSGAGYGAAPQPWAAAP